MAPIIDDLTPQSPINALAVPPPIENTWTRISKIVRGLDEAKVKDYKEDIDTILVFAGLFSAVLTAFLVESYQTLQQDPMNTVVSLLQQIAVQTSSFVVTSTFLNSTTPQQNTNTTSTFHPTINAQRINILWFASLVISLATASLGIIVKQWLREYLAGDYTSPQARLRIRHFRYPGLERWKVFEIAAVLPLLLQISLALFLVGLCYFTAEVHQSIGHTTLPLVSAWAFFIIAVSFFPVITPVCPYKTSLLKESMNAVRQQLFRITALWISSVSPHLLPKFLVSKAFKGRPLAEQKTLLYDEDQVVRDQKHDIEILLAVDAIQADDQLLNDVMWEALQQADLDPEDLAKFLFTVVGHRAQCDVSDLLPRQFLNLKALPKQTYAAIMDMVADLIIREARRLSLDASTGSTGNTSSDPTPTTITTNRDVPKLDQWLEHSICLLLSESKFLHSERVNKVLCHCLSETRHHHQLIPRLIHSRINILTSTTTSDSDSDTFLFVLERLKGGLALIEDTKKFLSIMQRLFQQPLSLPSPIRTPGPGPQLVVNAFADDGRSVHEEDTYFYVPKNCEQLVVELFVPRIVDAVERKRWTGSHYVLLTRTLELAYTGSVGGKGTGDVDVDGNGNGDRGGGEKGGQVIRPAVVKVVEKLLKSSSVGNAYAVYEVALGMNRKSGTAKAAAQDAYIDVVMSSSTEDRSGILSQFITFIKTHSQDHHYVHTVGTHSTTSVTFDPLSSTLLQLHLIHHIQETEGEPSNQHKHQWKHIFELLLPRIRLAFLWSRAEHRELAMQCLRFIELIEPSEWAVHLLNRPNSSQGSLFADELIQTLEDFLPYHTPVLTWRMHRLRLLESGKLPLTRKRVRPSRIWFPAPQRSFTPVPVSQLVRDTNGDGAVDDDSDVEELGDDDSPVGGDPLEKILTILGNPSSQRPADAETEPPSEPHEGEPTEGVDVTPKPEPYTPAHRRTPNRPADMDESSRISLLDRLAANFGVQLPLDASNTPGPEPPNVDPNVDATTGNDDKPSAESGQPRPTTPTPDMQTRTVDIATEMSTTPLLAALLSSLEVTDSGELQGIDRGSSEEDDRARVPVHPAAASILRALGLPVNSTDPEESSVDMDVDVGWTDPSLTVSELKEVIATHSSIRSDTQEELVDTPSVLPVEQPEQDTQAREQSEVLQDSADGQPVASSSLGIAQTQGANDQQKGFEDDETTSSPNPQIDSIQADHPLTVGSDDSTAQLEDDRLDDTITHPNNEPDSDKRPPDGAPPFSSLSLESLIGEVAPGDLPEAQNLEEHVPLTHIASEANVDQDTRPSERSSNGRPPLDGRSAQSEHEPQGPTQDVTDFAKWVAKVIGTDVEALVPDTSTSNGDDDAKIPEWMPWGIQSDESSDSGPLQHPQDAEAQNATRSEDNSNGAHLDVPVQEDTDGLEWLRLMLLETEEERSQDMQDHPSSDSPQGNVETEDDAHPEIIRAESDLREIQS